ncbi:MAG: ATP-dependent DNA helicase RecG [Lachnospiraceae bacterium]|nr:ATP-dependent DNA helicase RecG [Lachnospiraceae bacterium]
MDLYSDISSLKGIGEKTAALFHKVGVFSLYDLIYYFPVSHIRYPRPQKVSDIVPGVDTALKLSVLTKPSVAHIRGMSMVTFDAGDDTGSIKITYFNMPYIAKNIRIGDSKIWYGAVKARGSSYGMAQPRTFKEEEYESLIGEEMPVYPLTKHLTSRTVSRAVRQALEFFPKDQDYIPEDDRQRLGLAPLSESIYGMHFPSDDKYFLLSRERIVFDEFFSFLTSMKELKEDGVEHGNDFPMIEVAEASRLAESLPYRLTGAQKKAYDDIIRDMSSGHAMNRLIEGDVGSGKTIVVLLAMLTAVKNGHQAALMAPTEVLASQHMKKISGLMEDYDVKCVLLTGALTNKQKKEARRMIADGEADIIIGTHALITDLVEYKDLALCVTDEQHRFGVKQRETLQAKAGGKMPHVLVVSATPIPRTLAIILYGDLDISVMDELPAKRLAIKNALIRPDQRNKAYNFILKEVRKGHQAYVICPLVEPTDGKGGENALEYSALLRERWKDEVRVGMLNGRMKNQEKNEVMSRFSSGEIDVLVSTTVVEVGVDVPNSTVMMIEDAQSFGLAQLHQLRGRIGRGDSQSYCVFVDTSDKKEVSERLKVMQETNDGFDIASKDLGLRGPGDVFGIRQSGELGFRVADIYNDAALLKKASEYISSAGSNAYSMLHSMTDGGAARVVL